MPDTTAVFKAKSTAWLLLAPTLTVLAVFLYYPLLQSAVLSLYRSNLFLGTRKFIGIGNYASLFSGPFAPVYRQILLQSAVFSLAVVVLGLASGLALAALANQKVKGARVYRLLLIWPFALSPAVAGTVFAFMFNPEIGVVNQVLGALLGIKPRWLDNPLLAFGLAVAAAIWKNLGYNIVFYLAALQNVPREILEAASIDGAGSLRRFFSVTLAILSPMSFFLFFTNMTYSFFEAFGLIDILTRGGPVGPPPLDKAGVTTIFIYKIFEDGFGGSSNMGLAAAQGVLLMVLVVLITVLQFRTAGQRVHYGGG